MALDWVMTLENAYIVRCLRVCIVDQVVNITRTMIIALMELAQTKSKFWNLKGKEASILSVLRSRGFTHSSLLSCAQTTRARILLVSAYHDKSRLNSWSTRKYTCQSNNSPLHRVLTTNVALYRVHKANTKWWGSGFKKKPLAWFKYRNNKR